MGLNDIIFVAVSGIQKIGDWIFVAAHLCRRPIYHCNLQESRTIHTESRQPVESLAVLLACQRGCDTVAFMAVDDDCQISKESPTLLRSNILQLSMGAEFLHVEWPRYVVRL